jgi:predicted DCC family thiol-disulfide oxidoreductase YuxK
VVSTGGWTGGQHSLWRVGLALALACAAPTAAFDLPLGSLPALLLGLALAIGWRDRVAALLAIAVLGAGLTRDAIADLLLVGLLVLHAATPPAPFLSFDARERADPGGGWERPDWIGGLAWALPFGAIVCFPLGDGAERLATAGLAGSLVALSWTGFTIRRWRPTLWPVLALASIGFACRDGLDRADGVALLALALAADPGWWRGRSLRSALNAGDGVGVGATPGAARAAAHLFYDGDCGFCHRSVRFILAEERATPAALRTRFAPLASETFRAHLARHPELDPAALPDSIVFELEDGTVLTRSAAVLELASRLGGIWRGLALAARTLPVGLLDPAYDGIARVRKRLFATPKDVCPILPPALRARFDG